MGGSPSLKQEMVILEGTYNTIYMIRDKETALFLSVDEDDGCELSHTFDRVTKKNYVEYGAEHVLEKYKVLKSYQDDGDLRVWTPQCRVTERVTI